MILQKESITNAARNLMLITVESELEDADAGCSLPKWFAAKRFDKPDGEGEVTAESLVDAILKHNTADVMLTMGIIIGKIENAWGHSIGLVFHHMGFTDIDDQSSLLYRLIMGCMGHGICLDDDGPSGPVAMGFDNSGKILLNIIEDTGKRFEASPVHLDGDDPIRELISEHLEYEDTTCTA